MEKLRVNDTPVRTARNFLINNIEIELEMPEKIAEFKNIEIINNGFNYNYIDLTYIDYNSNIKRLSQIDKFNKRYKGV